MPDQPRPEAVTAGSNRYKLTEQLEATVKRLTGVVRESFVDQTSLCSSCTYASILRRSSQNFRTINCGIYSRQMPEDIAECSAYLKMGGLSLSTMVEMAYLINDREERNNGAYR